MQYLRPSRAVWHEARATIALALPLIGGGVAIIGMTTVDAVLAGHLSGEVLGAVAVGAALFHLGNMAAAGVNAAISPSVAQLDGAGRRVEIGALFRQAMLIAIVLGWLLAVVEYVLLPLLVGLLGLAPTLAADTRAFLHGIAPSLPAISIVYACRGLTEGLAMPRPTLLIGMLGLLVLPPIGYVLMYGAFGLPGQGAFGAGLADSIVAWVQAAGFALWLRYSGHYGGLGWRPGSNRPDSEAIAGLLHIGLPMAVTLLLESGMFSASGLAIGTIGAGQAAGHQVAINLASLTFMVPLGIALATTVRVGNAAGRGDAFAVRRAGLTGIGLGLAVQVLTAVLMLTLPETIAGLYATDPTVRATGARLLQVAGVFQLSDGVQVTANGALRGLKDTRRPMFLTAFAYWVVGFPLGLLLAFRAGWLAPGMWVGMIAGLTVAAALLTARFLALSGRLRRLTVTA
jgi:MATE family multidrug resistance protein